MNIFCTGATGLVGYNFVKAASEAGHKVLAVSNSHDLPTIKNVEQIKLDLTDASALQRVVLDMFPEMVVNCFNHDVDVYPVKPDNFRVIGVACYDPSLSVPAVQKLYELILEKYKHI